MERKRGGAHAELTCAAAAGIPGDASGACAFAGDSAGRVRRVFPAAEDAADVFSTAVDVFSAAVTSVCVQAERTQAEPLVVAGGADGALVFLRGDLELRRFRLDAAARRVAHLRGGEFLVGDLRGSLYCVTRHEILWKETLPSVADDADAALFPGAAEPLVAAISPVKLLDVQKVESSYVLVGAAQNALLLTHRGRVVACVRSRSPLTTVARWQPAGRGAAPDEDLVLAAGEEGVVYRLASDRGASTPERPDLQLLLEPWASVSFPIIKLLVVSSLSANADAALTWLAVGVYGQTALFRGQELVELSAAPGNGDSDDLLVDALLLSGSDSGVATVGLVFQDGIQRVDLKL